MVSQNSISSEWIKFVVDGLTDYGVDSHELCETVGIDYKIISQPNTRIPHCKGFELWTQAQILTSDPAIGLEFSRDGLHHQLKPLIFTFISNNSLKEVFERVVPYQTVMSTGVNLEVKEIGEGYLITFSHNDENDQLAEAAVDLMLSCLVTLSRWVMPKGFTPVRVEFEHELKVDIERYTSIFGENIAFSADKNSLLFSKADFEEHIPTADKELSDYCERLKALDLERINSESTYELIRLEVVDCLSSGDATIEALAKKHCMTTRTLQRKLKSEGWTFRELVEDIRQEFSEEYIGKQNKTVDECTRLLGFSETSSFIRAFKRWFDKTPNQYRKEYVKPL